MSDMRPSLLPGLIAAAQRNADRGFADLALFEVGQVYRGDRPEDQFDRRRRRPPRHGAAGNGSGRHWSAKSGAGLGVRRQGRRARSPRRRSAFARQGAGRRRRRRPWFHPGRSATIRQGPKTVIGAFGEFHPAILDRLDAEGPLAGFELILDADPGAAGAADQDQAAARPLRPAAGPARFRLRPRPRRRGRQGGARRRGRRPQADQRGVDVFDLFESDALGPGKKSLAIEVTLQPSERTLTDEEIDAVGQKVVAEVTKATGGTLRA